MPRRKQDTDIRNQNDGYFLDLPIFIYMSLGTKIYKIVSRETKLLECPYVPETLNYITVITICCFFQEAP